MQTGAYIVVIAENSFNPITLGRCIARGIANHRQDGGFSLTEIYFPKINSEAS